MAAGGGRRCPVATGGCGGVCSQAGWAGQGGRRVSLKSDAVVVGAGLPAKQAPRRMARASPVFAGKPAPTLTLYGCRISWLQCCPPASAGDTGPATPGRAPAKPPMVSGR
ncbi:hypothetical protein AL532_26435 [Pseudomonas monteilii]|uniref:Uncharacterized protein n=1 Tax=Pseudomonas monteilii TaxID=76759 RepID=A0A6G6UWL5_9PSED|nr:hypothetical protein AL532_26435 [Pseudomonas monteilii]MVF49611.1 hypothetical protein [Pseudomonas monteilii]QIG17732.1 hypothetical protein FY041_08140 [Pseudomonas monteilii]QIG22989.1 hypothetical protein FY043_08135 [Pseudomonas monteilii]